MFHQHDAPVHIDNRHPADSLTPLLDIFILSRNDVAILICTRALGVNDIFETGEGGERFIEGVVITAAALELFCELDAGVLMRDCSVRGKSVKVANGALGDHYGRRVSKSGAVS